MTTQESLSFCDRCRVTLGSFLADYGYEYDSTHHRPRGVAVEFRRGQHRLFAVCEGDVLYLDLILQIAEHEYVRASLNQAMWFNNVRSLVEARSCVNQLEVFIRDASGPCGPLLTGLVAQLDDRYCFRMSASDCEKYLESQTGDSSR
jgi:hypothetical protein